MGKGSWIRWNWAGDHTHRAQMLLPAGLRTLSLDHIYQPSSLDSYLRLKENAAIQNASF